MNYRIKSITYRNGNTGHIIEEYKPVNIIRWLLLLIVNPLHWKNIGWKERNVVYSTKDEARKWINKYISDEQARIDANTIVDITIEKISSKRLVYDNKKL